MNFLKRIIFKQQLFMPVMKNNLPNIKNKQDKIVRTSLLWTLFFAVVMVLPFYAGNPLSNIWGIAFIALFLLISSLVVAIIYQIRSRKMKNLLNKTELLDSWQMDNEMKKQYVEELSREKLSQSKVLLWVMSGFFLLFTLFFLFIMDDGRSVFLGIMGSVYLLVFASAKFFPAYYIRQNKRGDGLVLLGTKYAYINGAFHNWDFPLSGLTSIQPISQPFKGIELVYFYTVKNNIQTEEIRIPIPDSIDSENLIAQIQAKNTCI